MPDVHIISATARLLLSLLAFSFLRASEGGGGEIEMKKKKKTSFITSCVQLMSITVSFYSWFMSRGLTLNENKCMSAHIVRGTWGGGEKI